MRFSDHLKVFAHAVLAAGEDAARAVLAYLMSANGLSAIIGAAAGAAKGAVPNIVQALPPALTPAARAVLDATHAELEARRNSGFEENVHLAFQEHVVPVLKAAGVTLPEFPPPALPVGTAVA